jgi:probable addiction module antidote protein
MASKTSSYREALVESLADSNEAVRYLNAVLRDYPEGFLKALRNVAQARQMSKVAEEAGIQRETLYRALSDDGNPTLETFTSVLAALGLRMTIAPAGEITARATRARRTA